MRKLFVFGSLTLIIAVTAISYTNYNHRQNLARNKAALRLSALKSPSEEAFRQGKALSAVLDKTAIADAVQDPPLDQESFRELIYQANRMDRLAMEGVVQRLRANDLRQVAEMFLNELHELSFDQANARSQLVYAANLLQADELSSFWADLALRTTPRSANEAEVMGLTELTLDAKVIHGEMATAIRNLGLIGYRQPTARMTLELIILHPQPLSHPTFVREYAFYALKEADERAVLRILRGLPGTDPLRVAIRSSFAGK